MDLHELKQHLLVSYTAMRKHDELEEEANALLNHIHNKMLKEEKKQILKISLIASTVLFMGGLLALLTPFGYLSDFKDIMFEIITFDSFFLSLIMYAIFISMASKIYSIQEENITAEKLESKYWKDDFVKEDVAQFEEAKEKFYYFISTVEFQQDTAFVPEVYRSSEAIGYIYDLLDTGRADDFKEALNLYEDDMHEIRMENMRAQTLSAARNAEIASRNAEIAARNAEESSEEAAFYAAMAFYDGF